MVFIWFRARTDCLTYRTPIFICGVEDCYKLFPSRERVMAHRKRDHDSEEEAQEEIITWKMLEADQGET